MSIHGLMTGRRSVRADVKWPTTARTAEGESTTTWPITPTATVRGFLADITTDMARRVFGEGVVAHVRLLVPLDAPVREQDGLTLLDGALAGQRFRVTGRIIADTRPRSGHAELALETTPEVF